MKANFDIKNVFIGVLSAILVIMIIFNRGKLNKDTDMNKIEEENQIFKAQIQALNVINKVNEEKIKTLVLKADSLKTKLSENEKEIKKLIIKRNEIPKTVNNMSANDVASSLSDFIEGASR